jgi:type 1 glutamine amidotransferase
MRLFIICLLTILSLSAADQPERRVLVWTRNFVPNNGKSYVHDNIANNVTCIKELGAANGFGVDQSDDPAIWSDGKLKPYKALIFANANNQSFDNEEQKAAFQRYIRAGGGFVGIHSACGVERQWEWYWQLLGGTFVVHAKYGPFTIQVVDNTHPSTAHLGTTWEWTDEFYVLKNMNPNIHVLLAADLAKSPTPALAKKHPEFGTACPLAWCHVFEGARSFNTTLGHNKEVYLKDEPFRKHLLGGIQWAMGDGPVPTKK